MPSGIAVRSTELKTCVWNYFLGAAINPLCSTWLEINPLCPRLQVLWVQQQVLRKRVKRDLIEPSPRTSGGNWKPQWTDPGWKSMWYLVGGVSQLLSWVKKWFLFRQRTRFKLCSYLHNNCSLPQFKTQLKTFFLLHLVVLHIYFTLDF